MKDEVHAAGLLCSEVLAALDDFAEGTLSEEVAGRAQAHLRKCRRCEQFGSRYMRLIGELSELDLAALAVASSGLSPSESPDTQLQLSETLFARLLAVADA